VSDENALQGLRVLVLENDGMIQIHHVAIVEKLGCIARPAATIETSLRIIENGVDCGLLDYHLIAKQSSNAVADELDRRGIPYAFITGVPKEHLPEEYSHARVLRKPVRDHEVEEALREIVAQLQRSP
jgi:hypothetical protein